MTAASGADREPFIERFERENPEAMARARAEVAAAASGADRCTCGHSVASHDGWGQGACAAVRCSCETFTNPGADQPTLRDQLAVVLPHRAWCGTFHSAIRSCTCLADRQHDADLLLPLIEADRERAKAEALEKAAGVAESEAAYDDRAPDELQPRRLFAARLRQLAANLRFDADVLRATTGQPPDGGDVR